LSLDRHVLVPIIFPVPQVPDAFQKNQRQAHAVYLNVERCHVRCGCDSKDGDARILQSRSGRICFGPSQVIISEAQRFHPYVP
jgi:hypothetical protein